MDFNTAYQQANRLLRYDYRYTSLENLHPALCKLRAAIIRKLLNSNKQP